MDYRIVEKESYDIVGKRMRLTTKNGENFKKIPLFWNEFNSDGSCEVLEQVMTDFGYLGVCLNFDEEQNEFDYMIAVELKRGAEVPIGYERVTIPAVTWAIFEAVGPVSEVVSEVTNRIFREWLPATGYQLANAPELEVYPPGDVTKKDYCTQIWMPIQKG